MTDTLHAALYSIPADDRDTWVIMGMALKSKLGDAGSPQRKQPPLASIPSQTRGYPGYWAFETSAGRYRARAHA